ncbi:hypothetical protein Tel_12635 [Candidatus Tenderia electrophaga]|uniref:Uncharacterized protein n=1 Tax=Candidatus Tenderia electrophaga TaxID=1748243 RepID=A0A0S2TFI9_9GAMM|nr:hypothetical protein Tel_12635 [Candidatus Tenderia electrophaga]
MNNATQQAAGCIALDNVKFPCVCAIVLLMFTMMCSGLARAAENLPGGGLHEYAVLSDDTLDTLRGGFVTSNGLEIDVGIERLVYLNDTLQSSFAMNLSHINREALAAQVGPQFEPYMQQINGGQGAFALQASGMLNIIQNSLDGQKIGHITGLDIDVKNFRDLRIPDLGRMVDFEVTRSLSSIR